MSGSSEAGLFSLAGRVALVTGGHKGIGAGFAVALAAAGADVALLDRSDPAATLASIAATGQRGLWVPGDLLAATPTSLADAVSTVVSSLGGLDILVNNAGIIRRAPALEHPASDWDEVLAVDLSAVFHLSQAAGQHMAARPTPAFNGKIINVASMLSFQGGIRVPSYTAAKSGLLGLTRALANEWASLGINVNAIAPGYIATDNTAPLRSDVDRERSITERIPAGRWGTPDDLAGSVVFLASAASDYVHGAVLPVDGGWLAR